MEQTDSVVYDISDKLSLIADYLETFNMAGPTLHIINAIYRSELVELYPISRINPDEPISSLVQDSAIRGIIPVSSYVCAKEDISMVDRLLIGSGLSISNKYFDKSAWEEMVCELVSICPNIR